LLNSDLSLSRPQGPSQVTILGREEPSETEDSEREIRSLKNSANATELPLFSPKGQLIEDFDKAKTVYDTTKQLGKLIRVPRFAILPLIVPMSAFILPFLGDLFSAFKATITQSKFSHPAELVDRFLDENAHETETIAYKMFYTFKKLGFNNYYTQSEELHIKTMRQLSVVTALVAPALEGRTPADIFSSQKIRKIVKSIYDDRATNAQFDPRLTTSILIPDSNPHTFRILTKVPVTDPQHLDLVKAITLPIYISGNCRLPLVNHEYFAVTQDQNHVLPIEDYSLCNYAFCPKSNIELDNHKLPCGPAQYFNTSILECPM
jgi:hypothetical protein